LLVFVYAFTPPRGIHQSSSNVVASRIHTPSAGPDRTRFPYSALLLFVAALLLVVVDT
jgi:hypothetical protein